jgi:hypothetical protein
LDETQADLKDGEVAAAMAINEMTKAFVDSLGTEGDKLSSGN